MSLEVANGIWQLNASWPDGDLDDAFQGDDHIRLIKNSLKLTFPNILGSITASHTEINFLVGVTSSVLHSVQKNIANGVGGLDAAARLLNAQMPSDPSFTTVRLTSTTPADLSSGAHAFQIGLATATNLALSSAVLQARQNGSASALSINPFGGSIVLGKATDSAILIPQGAAPGIYYQGRKVLNARSDAAGAGGIEIGPSSGGLLYHDGGALLFRNQISSGTVGVQGYTNAAALVTLFNADPNGSFNACYNGALKFQTSSQGYNIYGDATLALHYYLVNGAIRGRVSAAATEFQFVGENDVDVKIYGGTSGGVYTEGIKVASNGAVSINGTPIATVISNRVNAWQGLVQGGVTGSVSGANGTTTVTFASPYTGTPSVVITPNTSTGNLNGNASVFNVSSTGFSVLNSQGISTTFNWIAIGTAA